MKKMFVILDTSGSMGENEKKSSLIYTIYALEGIMKNNFFNVQYECYQWAEDINKFHTINEINFNGRLNENIIKFLVQKVNEKILFITDGNFERSLINKMKYFIEDKKKSFSVIAVGCDCNIATLKKIFGRDNVYYSYDIATCISNLLYS